MNIPSRFSVCLGLVITVTGCVFQSQIAIAQEAQVQNIAQQVTVRIDGANTGSGVIVNRQADIYTVLTNWHVVAKTGDYTIQTYDGKTYKVDPTKIKQIGNIDLAEVQFVSQDDYRQVNLYFDPLVTGTKVFVTGWADPDQVSIDREYVPSPLQAIRVVQKPKNEYALVLSYPTKPGMSGGPILDEQGRLVGINGQARKNIITDTTDFLGIPIQTYLNIVPPQQSAPPLVTLPANLILDLTEQMYPNLRLPQ